MQEFIMALLVICIGSLIFVYSKRHRGKSSISVVITVVIIFALIKRICKDLTGILHSIAEVLKGNDSKIFLGFWLIVLGLITIIVFAAHKMGYKLKESIVAGQILTVCVFLLISFWGYISINAYYTGNTTVFCRSLRNNDINAKAQIGKFEFKH